MGSLYFISSMPAMMMIASLENSFTIVVLMDSAVAALLTLATSKIALTLPSFPVVSFSQAFYLGQMAKTKGFRLP